MSYFTDNPFVLANENGRGIFNFYPTMTAARDDQPRANGAEFSSGPYEPMTYTEFERRNRNFWLTDPIQITEKQWMYALEVLPPDGWVQEPGFNSFLMSERTSGSFTNQYVRYGTGDNCTYWEKMVDLADRSTWMKRDECPSNVNSPEFLLRTANETRDSI